MSAKYTVEQFEAMARNVENGYGQSLRPEVCDMLRYAADLARKPEASNADYSQIEMRIMAHLARQPDGGEQEDKA